MATRRDRPFSLITAVLDVLRQALRTNEILTAAEIFRRIPFPPRYYIEYKYREMVSPRDFIHEAMADLMNLGLVEKVGYDSDAVVDGTGRWRLNPDWMAMDGGNGGENGPPAAGDGGDTDGPGGDGSLREVLGHRYLFALSEDDFEVALTNALRLPA